jgi:hypothetical protein
MGNAIVIANIRRNNVSGYTELSFDIVVVSLGAKFPSV